MRSDEIERTLSHGERAFAYLRANGIPAYPQNYELWYTYSAGFNAELNAEIDEIMARDGRIVATMAAELYEKHLSPGRLRDRVDEVSSNVSLKIHEVLELLDSSERNVGGFGEALRAASDGLGDAQTQAQARTIIERILAATAEIESKNAALEQQLSDSRQQIEGLHDSLEVIRFESLTDQLTGLANRKHFNERLEQAIADAERGHRKLCLALCDIDHFKRFNDTYGHQTGDQVLRLVGAAIRGQIKGHDLAARYGGEEFAIIMLDTELRQAAQLTEKIRTAVVEKELAKKSTGESLGRVTLSGGVTNYLPGEPIETLIERADALLYEAKRSGRNRVHVRDGGLKGRARVA